MVVCHRMQLHQYAYDSQIHSSIAVSSTTEAVQTSLHASVTSSMDVCQQVTTESSKDAVMGLGSRQPVGQIASALVINVTTTYVIKGIQLCNLVYLLHVTYLHCCICQ